MTMKTKRRLAIGSGTTLCATLALLIVMRFTPENEQRLTASAPETSAESTVNTSNNEKPQSTDIPDNDKELDSSDSESNADPQPESASDDIIAVGGIEVTQGFPKSDTDQSDPPEPPKTEDKSMPTEPTYTPEQLKPKPPTATTTPTTTSNTPKHGDTKDGMIYITGFGWIKDEGGGGRGEAASDMYENGNKIGYFG